MDKAKGFALSANSPAIGAGMIIEGTGGRDFAGNPVPSDAAPDIGAFQLAASTSIVPVVTSMDCRSSSYRNSMTAFRFVDLQGRILPMAWKTRTRDSFTKRNTGVSSLIFCSW
jgi:hypothetical protein